MIGVPPLLGFVAKESVLAALVDGERVADASPLVVVVGGSVLTTAYSIRAVVGPVRHQAPRRAPAVHVHHRPELGRLVGPVVLLAVVSLVGGLARADRRPTGSTSAADVARRRQPRSTSRCGPGCTCRCCSRSLIVVVGRGRGVVGAGR